MTSPITRFILVGVACVGAAAFGFSQKPAPAPPPTQTPAQTPPAGRGGRAGRGGLEQEIAMGADFSRKPSVERLSPGEQQKRFLLPPGFRIEPLLSDPLIEDPVGVTFDGNGRMYVLEMRSYMQDAAGSNSRAPISRISRHEDTDGDGTYDRHTVFADKLVLPRMAFPLRDGEVLVLETDDRDLFKYTDTDGDGVADRKELFFTPFGRVTNMEWQPGGLTWALDNWLYSTYNPFRLRITPAGGVIREETDTNGGQWWSAQDDHGKVWFVDGGGEIGPVNFQVPIAYGAINVRDNFEPDFQVPWPAPGGIADMQGGMRRVRMPDGTLNHFTSASGVEIYRGHRMPEDMVGDLFFTEPVGRIVRRAKVVVTDGLTQLRNAYPKSEFVRSTDPLFRPVNVTAAPDGSLLVIDMYTGIIQDAQFVGPYLKAKIDQYALDKQHNWGRIWRITHETAPPDRTQPRMYRESAAELVRHLEHQHGWWRDTAQKLLVLRQEQSVVPALRTMAGSSPNPLARIHALWTLEGLEALDLAFARKLMKDSDPQIRIQAIRASESLYKRGEKSLADDYRAMAKDSHPDVVIQALLTVNLHKVPGSAALIEQTMAASQVRGIREIGAQLLKPGGARGQGAAFADPGAGTLGLPVEQRRSLQRGAAIYQELCTTCHGPDGKGAPMGGAADGSTLAPSLVGSARVLGHREYIIKVLLHGLSGDIDGVSYPGGIMAPMGTNTDEWIADAANYTRNSFGNSASFITPAHVASVRAASRRETMWTLPELLASLPTLLTNQGEWKATASHNPENAANGINGTGDVRWDSGAPQAPGMWFQLELPATTRITELLIEASAGGRGGFGGFGRGRGRGRSGAGTFAGPLIAYEVRVSTDGTTWSKPVGEGRGTGNLTVVTFAPVEARFIRITQTGAPPPDSTFQFGWAVQRVRIYQAGT
ncbi:MAG TPA: c-type cytochrome [Vicinamibacterales bacterium]|nr:c-type cytochrome [Vicinamibacterales bacterium]